MVKYIKYTAALTHDADCSEKLPNCEKKAALHVCFEDGSGASVCRMCFKGRINEGDWITDEVQTLLAS